MVHGKVNMPLTSEKLLEMKLGYVQSTLQLRVRLISSMREA